MRVLHQNGTNAGGAGVDLDHKLLGEIGQSKDWGFHKRSFQGLKGSFRCRRPHEQSVFPEEIVQCFARISGLL
jgi:hypothetical protein